MRDPHTPRDIQNHDYRQVMVRENLKAWLTTFGAKSYRKTSTEKLKASVRSLSSARMFFGTRFSSMHVAAFKSVGEAALEAETRGGDQKALT